MSVPGCYLEWHPYSEDREMGLNHQMASLSCSMSEAFYLGRTLVIPSVLCLFGLHTERWPGDVESGARCVPIGEIFDTDRLSDIVPVYLRANKTGWALHHFPQDGAIVNIPSRGWTSQRIRQAYPCEGPAKLVRRHVDSFWFSQCTRGVVDTDKLAGAMNKVGAIVVQIV